MNVDWQADRLLEGYEYLPLELPLAMPAVGEPEDAVLQGGLIRRAGTHHDRAVMYVHGWSDYFFQRHLADFFDELGFDFYAVELRRYGRGLGEGQLGGFITDLDEYSQELDAALEVIRTDHDSVTVMGHSTGGLIVSLWASQRAGELNGVILNSPWLDLQGSPLLNAVTGPVVGQLGTRIPTAALNLPDSGNYARSIHSSKDGEWDFDLDLKQHPSFAVRVGWLRAILKGHDRVAKGLDIDTPVLAMMSTKSDFRRSWDETLMDVDTVLDVEKLAKRAVWLGPHVTVVRIKGGLHDLVLSREPVRTKVMDEMRRWIGAYLD